MRRMMPFLVAAAFCAPVAVAEEIGSAKLGEQYARERCADCHAIDRQTQVSPDRNAPRFEVIANTPGMTSIALSAWMYTSHKDMPNLIVKSPDLENVIAWITSLKSRPEGR